MALVLTLAVTAACGAGLRATPETRYQGIMLNARTLGAQQLQDDMARDPTLRAYVESHGPPDFIYVASPTDVELVYYLASRLVHFRHHADTGETTVTEQEPLPTPLLNILPRDLRAGTPTPSVEEAPNANCWRIPVGDEACRTCCVGAFHCSTSCS
jgi:hypothetical protein